MCKQAIESSITSLPDPLACSLEAYMDGYKLSIVLWFSFIYARIPFTTNDEYLRDAETKLNASYLSLPLH